MQVREPRKRVLAKGSVNGEMASLARIKCGGLHPRAAELAGALATHVRAAAPP